MMGGNQVFPGCYFEHGSRQFWLEDEQWWGEIEIKPVEVVNMLVSETYSVVIICFIITDYSVTNLILVFIKTLITTIVPYSQKHVYF